MKKIIWASQSVFVLLLSSCFGTAPQPEREKTLLEQYPGEWRSSEGNKDITQIQEVTIERVLAQGYSGGCDEIFVKKYYDFENNDKCLIACHSDYQNRWNYYVVWISSEKKDGPLQNDGTITHPKLK